MKEDKSQVRDSKGDIVSNVKITPIDWRNMQNTKVFEHLNKDYGFYQPYYSKFDYSDEGIQKATKELEDFYCKKLYVMPEKPPYDLYISYYNWQLGLLVNYFKDVFEERAFIEGHQPSHEYTRLILPKALHDEIINVINDYNLLLIRDLIFEVIAIAREKYSSEIASWEKPEMQQIVKTAYKETEKVIDLIDRLDDKEFLRGQPNAKPPSELSHINFVLNDGTVKIKHPWLSHEFVDHFKNYYNNLIFKNWRLDLKRYPLRFEENIYNQEFKYRLAKSFYNLLTETNQFVINGAKTPNSLMLCIAKLLEFCLIPVGSFDEIDEMKITHVRNWLKRKDFEPSIISAEVPADLDRLKKYFEADFIDLVEESKGVDVLYIGEIITKRFGIEHLFSDIVHLSQALKQSNMFIGHQMSIGGIRKAAPFKEFGSFQKLVDGMRNKEKIISMKFMLEGDDKVEYELTQRLPLYLIEEAMKNYFEDHDVEIDTEIVPTRITKMSDGGIRVDKDPRFNEPEERFMVHFTQSFYDFLHAESPPGENEYRPSTRYYSIIANVLQQSGFFKHKRHEEWFVINKVKQWHKLSVKH